LIVGFVGFAMYCAIGSAYNFKVKELRGTEIIPQKEKWLMLPGLIKDGVMFTGAGLKSGFERLRGGSGSM